MCRAQAKLLPVHRKKGGRWKIRVESVPFAQRPLRLYLVLMVDVVCSRDLLLWIIHTTTNYLVYLARYK